MFLKLAAIAVAALTLGGCMAILEQREIDRKCGPKVRTVEWYDCALAVMGPARAPIPVATSGGGGYDRRPINCTSNMLAGTVVTTCN